MDNRGFLLRFLFSLCAFVVIIKSVPAEAASFNIQQISRPAPSTEYITIFGSNPTTQGLVGFDLYFDYSAKDLSFFNAKGDKVHDIIKDAAALYFLADIRPVDWFDFGLTFSGVPYINYQAPNSASANQYSKLADMRLDTRFRLLDRSSYPIGIALVPFINLPTGSSMVYLSDGSVSGGGLVVIDTKKLANRISFAINGGYEARGKATLSAGTSVDDFVIYGAGANLSLFKYVDLIAEARGLTFTTDPFSKNRRPLEVGGALRFNPDAPCSFTIAGAGGVLSGIGSSKYRVTVGLSVLPGKRKPSQPEVVVPPSEEKVEEIEKLREQLSAEIMFETGSADIKPKFEKKLDDIASVIKESGYKKVIQINGHTDSTGSEEENKVLSELRAVKVECYLIDRGVDEMVLTHVGFGSSQPQTDNTTEKGRAQNRRVNFTLL